MKSNRCMAIFASITLFLTCAYSQAQSKKLKIGDTINSEIILKMSNFKTSQVKIKDFKDKLLLIDFWDRWCGSCIAAMPKMQQLQKQYGDKIFILPVTKSTQSEVQDFSQKNPILSNLNFYSAVEDNTLSHIFPHRMIPHVVWIDGNGVVRAITGANEVNTINISLALEDKINFKEKKDVLDFDSERPLLIGNNGAGEESFLHRSIFTPYISGIPSKYGRTKGINDSTIRIYGMNVPILDLYSLAFPQFQTFSRNRIILNVKDKTKFINSSFLRQEDRTDSLKGETAELWCYDLITRQRPIEQLRLIVKKDLDSFFGIDSRIENKRIACIVLTKNGQDVPITDENYLSAKANSSKVSNFIDRYNNINGRKFIINKLNGYDPFLKDIDIEINEEQLENKLLEYGIVCQQSEIEMEVFVLSETDNILND